MERKEIVDKVNLILSEILGVEADSIVGGDSFEGDYGCDSLDCVDIVMTMEREFSISIQDEDAFGCKTVGQLYDLVENAIKERNKGISLNSIR